MIVPVHCAGYAAKLAPPNEVEVPPVYYSATLLARSSIQPVKKYIVCMQATQLGDLNDGIMHHGIAIALSIALTVVCGESTQHFLYRIMRQQSMVSGHADCLTVL